MDTIEKFDAMLHALLTELTELAFEYVNNNKDEVDAVYVIGLIESGYFYKQFYRVNNVLVKAHKANTVSAMQYDLSKDRSFGLLKLGNECLARTGQLFEDESREAPSILKLVYHPGSGRFDSELGYGRNFTDSSSRTAQDVYEDWFDEIGRIAV